MTHWTFNMAGDHSISLDLKCFIVTLIRKLELCIGKEHLLKHTHTQKKLQILDQSQRLTLFAKHPRILLLTVAPCNLVEVKQSLLCAALPSLEVPQSLGLESTRPSSSSSPGSVTLGLEFLPDLTATGSDFKRIPLRKKRGPILHSNIIFQRLKEVWITVHSPRSGRLKRVKRVKEHHSQEGTTE